MNIYERTQDNDLFKYLSDAQVTAVEVNCTDYSLAPGQRVYNATDTPDSIIMLKTGQLELRRPDGSNMAFLYPGEIECEYACFQPEPLGYELIALKPSTITKLSYTAIKYMIQPDHELGARIQAALNDSLCLKIVRLTHRRGNG